MVVKKHNYSLLIRITLLPYFLLLSFAVVGQEYIRPKLPIGKIVDPIKLDGDLTEKSWQEAPLLTQYGLVSSHSNAVNM